LRHEVLPTKLRYFQCGEYGEKNYRPHHHAILFGFDFSDKQFDSARNGYDLYTSDLLDGLWTHGRCAVGSATYDSACYVARYIMKKRLGKDAKAHYESLGHHPEYITMSRRPGIGKTFYDLFKDDMYNYDMYIGSKKMKVKPPKYYDKMFDIDEPERMKAIKANRIAAVDPYPDRKRLEDRDRHLKKSMEYRTSREL